MIDYKALGFNQYFQPLYAPITTSRAPLPGGIVDVNKAIQAVFANMSNVNIKNFVFQTGTSDASFTLANNGSANITSRSSNNPPHAYEPIFGQIYTALYEGTAAVGSMQIFPAFGAGVVPTNYRIWGGRDWNVYRNQDIQGGDVENYSISLVNVSGVQKDFYFVNQTKYIQYNANQSG